MAPQAGREDGRSRHRAVYVISVAAELAGVHPQTLRIYERRGLIEPERTPGRSRRFSDDDIDRLRHIQELTGEGLSLAGVRRFLDLEDLLGRARREVEHLHEVIDDLRRQQRHGRELVLLRDAPRHYTPER